MANFTVPASILTTNGNEFGFAWIQHVPIRTVLGLRNARHVLENTYNNTPISVDEHATFIANYDELERADFICRDEQTSEWIGGFSFVKTSRGLEIGNYIGNTKYLGRGFAFPIMGSLICYIGKYFGNETPLVSITKMENFKNINLNFKLGFTISRQLDDQFWLMTRHRTKREDHDQTTPT